MSGVREATRLVGMGVAAGFAIGNMVLLVWFALDVIAARAERCSLWPDPGSLTVWTGEDWVTVTVMPVAFGRWGVAACRDAAPRRAGPLELIERERTERKARGCARLLAMQVLGDDQLESLVMVATARGR